MRMNANEIPYEEATLFGQPVLFTDYRIDRTTVPPQLNLYELRHCSGRAEIAIQRRKN